MVELYFAKPESRVALKPGALSGIGIQTSGAVLSGKLSVADALVGFRRRRRKRRRLLGRGVLLRALAASDEVA